jgi:hypothetical protein
VLTDTFDHGGRAAIADGKSLACPTGDEELSGRRLRSGKNRVGKTAWSLSGGIRFYFVGDFSFLYGMEMKFRRYFFFGCASIASIILISSGAPMCPVLFGCTIKGGFNWI